ncbi:acetyl-CoA C-acetyltransferase [Helicobacter muridarum]|uniref:Acetyl-CoA C-acetyltransferase n=1 Tax=Helicobacter muridarum TaxID=216 RepID=A0A099TXE6_9HELI|nr:acetyl-CoA C-acetyltransferase [Helicobacter muridarum]TLE01318.1 acetyl-CoA C-acetyltransferase [Helicobacter muridarum]STQ87188.1 acetyl-CoA acetyltransferase 2 [Helicobacter muridarum]
MQTLKEVVIVAAKRTPIGSFLGSLKDIKALILASTVAKAIIEELRLDPTCINSLILGQVLQSTQGQNLARQVALQCNMSVQSNGYVINDVCGSGLKAVELAYNSIALGENEIVLAGGVENMSLAPFALERIRSGYRMGNQTCIDTMIQDGLWCAINNYHMGITAENIAKQYKISRQEQDRFSLDSQIKAGKAINEGTFKDEVVPLSIQEKKEQRIFAIDEFVKSNTTIESLSKLKPAFDKEGSVTAGNSSGINDGAAMLLLMDKNKAKELGMPILAQIKNFGNVGVEPSIMGIGAAFAAKTALQRAKLNINDIDLIEANEAFASQSIATIRELGLDNNLDKVNIHGGAIALGHPIGASGARILTTLIYAMRRQKKNLGLATLCIGGGQGISTIIEINE